MLMLYGSGFAQQSFPAKAMFDSKAVSVHHRITKQSKNVNSDSTTTHSRIDTASIHNATVDTTADTNQTTTQRFGIYGIGNINEQSLTQINAGGKLSCFFIPYIHKT